MRILLTGASGFIGASLWDILEQRGHSVIGVGRHEYFFSDEKKKQYVQYEIGNDLPTEIIEFSPDTVVNLAWNGIPDFSFGMCLKNLETHAEFLQKISELKSVKKIVVSGTCMEYGNKTGSCKEDEKNPPHSFFSWAKQSLYELFRLQCAQESINLVWFRIFYVYGPRQRSGSLIPTLITSFKEGNQPVINNPSASNDYVYIDDVVEAFVSAIENPESKGIYNLGSGERTPLYRIAKIIEKLVLGNEKFSQILETKALQNKVENGLCADIVSAQSFLNWTPKWSIERGITEMCKPIISL